MTLRSHVSMSRRKSSLHSSSLNDAPSTTPALFRVIFSFPCHCDKLAGWFGMEFALSFYCIRKGKAVWCLDSVIVRRAAENCDPRSFVRGAAVLYARTAASMTMCCDMRGQPPAAPCLQPAPQIPPNRMNLPATHQGPPTNGLIGVSSDRGNRTTCDRELLLTSRLLSPYNEFRFGTICRLDAGRDWHLRSIGNS